MASLWQVKIENKMLLFGKYIAYLLKMPWHDGIIWLAGDKHQNLVQGKTYSPSINCLTVITLILAEYTYIYLINTHKFLSCPLNLWFCRYWLLHSLLTLHTVKTCKLTRAYSLLMVIVRIRWWFLRASSLWHCYLDAIWGNNDSEAHGTRSHHEAGKYCKTKHFSWEQFSLIGQSKSFR